MAVIVENIRMPKKCIDCEFLQKNEKVEDFPFVSCYLTKNRFSMFNADSSLPIDCPLKEVTIIAYICNKTKDCEKSPRCGEVCNCTTEVGHARNFVKLGNNHYIEIPRPQQVTGSWEPIGGTDEAMCSFCFARMKPRTFHGQTFKQCPMCGTFMELE